MHRGASSILDGMDDLEKELNKAMSHEEIVRRFRKLFGRDMTPIERQAFFVDYESLAQNSDNNSSDS
jgi:hypothetical protein